jgi:hypothetical protein
MDFMTEEIFISFLRSRLIPQGSRHLFMIRSLPFILIPGICLGLSLHSCKYAALDPPPVNDTLVYIMAGQSNMAGRGVVAPEDTVISPRVLELDANGALAPKHEPNTINQGALAGLDCGRSFGNELLVKLNSNTTLLLVQCSIGSTVIGDWLGDSVRLVPLYSNLLGRTKAAITHGKLKGVLWHQGEGNADNEPDSRNYARDLAAFISKYRSDLGIPNLPFFVGMLPSWCIKPYTQTINADIRSVAASLPGVYIIGTDDLTAKGDKLHFDAQGQRELGKRFAQLALQTLQ